MAADEERAECGAAALDAHIAYVSNDDEERETQLSDLLADLMHYCESSGVSFENCLCTAQCHFEEELVEVGQ